MAELKHSDDEALERIYSRVRKLMALAANNSNESQAAEAASKAQELMMQYGLSQYRLDQVQHLGLVVERKTNELKYRKNLDWRSKLAETVAHNSFCFVFFSDADIVFVGRQADIDTAIFVFNNLESRLLKLATEKTYAYTQQWKKMLGGMNPYKGVLTSEEHPRVWRNAWLAGAVAGIDASLKQARERFTATPHAKELIVFRATELSEYMKQHHPTLELFYTTGPQNDQAFSEGYQAGAELGVQRGVESASRISGLLE